MSKKKKRSTFLSVDVWQKEFSKISVAAVFSIFERTFGVGLSNMNKYSFQHCVESLRYLEDPDYIPHVKISKLT